MAITFDDNHTTPLLDALGLDADTSNPQLVVTAVEDLVAQTADLSAQVEGLDASKPATIVAAAHAVGLEVVDKATLDALRHDAIEGRRLATEAAQAKVEQQVDAAIEKGKIQASSRQHWCDLITADTSMADLLDRIPPETAVPLTELGHSTEPKHDDGAWVI